MSLFLLAFPPAETDSLTIMFWNLENFFDFRDSGTSGSDHEFSAGGARHWTAKRFYRKCQAVCKTILMAADRFGRLPDVAAFAEVENMFCMNSLVNSTVLRKLGYKPVHHESHDRRGIDCALIYRSGTLALEGSGSLGIPDGNGGLLPTRDILQCSFRLEDGSLFHILVNHHPSKYGGLEDSGFRRTLALSRMNSAADSLLQSGNVLCIGDFNEQPVPESLAGLSDSLVDLSVPLFEKGIGTIRFDGKWELIDRAVTSRRLAPRCSMYVFDVPQLSVRKRGDAGEKPLRTYSGPGYLGGVSDHYPIIVRIKVQKSMF